MSNIETIVIVGAGQAGASAILELRSNKYEGNIILIGDETHLPYERPPLPKDVILKPQDTKIEILSEEKLAVILGTEGDGLASQTIADCDYTVKIPMSHGVDSLNVAAASAVAFWELGHR